MAKSSFPIIFFATILCFSPLFYYASASYLSVEGQVYCDTCRVEFQTKLNEPLPGAKVLLECRSRETDQVTYSVQGEADSSGTYRLPVDGDYEEDICEVKLTKSPREDCSDLFKTSINTARVLLTKNVGVVDPTRFANALGYMTKEAKAECGQVLEDMGFLPLDD